MSMLDDRKKREGKAHFRDLAILALIDGKIDPAEEQFLSVVGAGCGLDQEEISSVLANLRGGPTEIPFDKEERLNYLNDLIALMLADREVTSDELEYCIKIATRLGFKPVMVKNLVAELMQNMNTGKSPDEIKADIEYLLGNS